MNEYSNICGLYTIDVFPNYTIIYLRASWCLLRLKGAVPMKHSSLEPSFADAIMAITAATDLSAQTRRHWCSSLTGIAKAFDQPTELIPARYSAIRARMAALRSNPHTVNDFG